MTLTYATRSEAAQHVSAERLLTHLTGVDRRQAVTDRTCSIEGCSKPMRYVSKGWCNQHYQAWYRYGDPLGAPGNLVKGTCSIDGCGAPHKGHGWCATHWMRWRKHGSPDIVLKGGTKPGRFGPDSASWKGSDIGYGAAHVRVRTMRGRASNNSCVECGRTAQDWAYDHQDPDELIDQDQNLIYSAKIEHYMPMCHSCHIKMDRRYRSGD